MREGLKLSRKLAHSESFNKYKGEEIFPGKNVQSDDELDAYIRDVRTNRCRNVLVELYFICFVIWFNTLSILSFSVCTVYFSYSQHALISYFVMFLSYICDMQFIRLLSMYLMLINYLRYTHLTLILCLPNILHLISFCRLFIPAML